MSSLVCTPVAFQPWSQHFSEEPWFPSGERHPRPRPGPWWTKLGRPRPSVQPVLTSVFTFTEHRVFTRKRPIPSNTSGSALLFPLTVSQFHREKPDLRRLSVPLYPVPYSPCSDAGPLAHTDPRGSLPFLGPPDSLCRGRSCAQAGFQTEMSSHGCQRWISGLLDQAPTQLAVLGPLTAGEGCF